MPLRLDRNRAEASLADLRRVIADPLQLRADTSGVLGAASSALSSIRNSFAGTTLQLKATITVTGDLPGGNDSGDGSEGADGGYDNGQSETVRAATGGRYTRRTAIEIAEDGDPEYIIPVGKESMAVPLLRQALAEISDSARKAVVGDEVSVSEMAIPKIDQPELTSPEIKFPEITVPDIAAPEMVMPDIVLPEIDVPNLDAPDIQLPEISLPEISYPKINMPEIDVPELTMPEISLPELDLPEIDLSALDALAGLTEMMAAASAATSGGTTNIMNTENRTVEAPVNINVTASGVDAQMMGQSIYDSAQRYLEKTIRGAF